MSWIRGQYLCFHGIDGQDGVQLTFFRRPTRRSGERIEDGVLPETCGRETQSETLGPVKFLLGRNKHNTVRSQLYRRVLSLHNWMEISRQERYRQERYRQERDRQERYRQRRDVGQICCQSSDRRCRKDMQGICLASSEYSGRTDIIRYDLHRRQQLNHSLRTCCK